ncbi:hypothetical protein K8I28_14975, partial [bacterium]|nr:hypothetical protein [bacterium]
VDTVTEAGCVTENGEEVLDLTAVVHSEVVAVLGIAPTTFEINEELFLINSLFFPSNADGNTIGVVYVIELTSPLNTKHTNKLFIEIHIFTN